MPRVHIDPTPTTPDRPTVEPREFTDRRITGKVVLDNTSFERCAFENVTLIYYGGAPPSIRDCTFHGVAFKFDGAAGRTLGLLQAMTSTSSGFRDVFKASFPKLFGH